MEILAILVIIYALRHAITDTKHAAGKSRQAYLKSAAERFPDMPAGKRAAHAARHDLGWVLSQLGHGLPATRHGFMTGWHQSREAHHQAMLGRQAAKTAHLETRAGAIGQLKEYRARQQAALQEIRSGKVPGKRGWLVTGMPGPKEGASPVEEGTPEGSSPRRFPVMLTATSKSGRPINPLTGGPTDWARVGDGEDLRRRLDAADRDPDIETTVEPITDGPDDPEPTGSPGDTTVTEDHWDDPLPGEEGSPEGTSSTDPETASPTTAPSTEGDGVGDKIKNLDKAKERARKASEGGKSTWVGGNDGKGNEVPLFAYRDGKEVPLDGAGSSSTGSTASTGGSGMADTSYAQIQSDMQRDQATAEAAASGQEQHAAQQEQAASEAQAALTQTNATIDAAAGLELDGETAAALMDHAEAQRDAAEKTDAAHEASTMSAAAHQHVQETAQTVLDVLARNHGQYQEAHDNSPVSSAQSGFYES